MRVNLGRGALILVVLTTPLAAHAAKPKAKAAAEPANPSALTQLKVVVDRTVTLVDQFIRDVKAAGDDGQRLTELGKRFQSQMQATEVEMEALQKTMDVAQRAAGENYGRDKLGPRMEAMQAALELVQQAAEGEDDDDKAASGLQTPGAEKFRAEIARIAAEAESLQQLARSAGRDVGKREDVRQRVAKLGGARNAAWQNLRQDTTITNPRKLFKDGERAIEGKLQRVDRLLRLGLQPTCEAFEAEKLTVAEMAADARHLVDELAQVSDTADLEAIKTRFARVVSGLDGLAWQKLASDERQELASLVTESVSVATEQFMERAEALQHKLAP
jgi:hypothetical protein